MFLKHNAPTIKTSELVDEAKSVKGDDLTKSEVIKVAGPVYIPAVVTVGRSREAGGVFYGYSWVDFYHDFHESEGPDMSAYYTIRMPFNPTADFLDY